MEMEENAELSNKEISDKAKRIYLIGCYWMTIALVEIIANSMSLFELRPIFRDLYVKYKGSVAYGLIYIAIEMHSSKKLPKAEIAKFYREVALDALGRRMLRQIVLRFLYLNPIDYKDKQWLSQTIELPIQQQLLASSNTK
jgi:hypothetical protein